MLLRLWILWCAAVVAGGWLLSLFRELNALGYLAILVLFGIGVLVNARFLAERGPWHFRRHLRRFLSWRRPLPLLFAVMSALLLWRGLVIAPFHGDALSYRIPRMLNWIAEGHWYWIDAQDSRLNTRGFGSEWLTLPILLASGGDQLMFLPNWICYLFFPQLIFRVWRDWGVRSRVAWVWMWLLPAGFCYSLQACNASNDIIGTFFALAAFTLLRRRENIPPIDVLCSILAIALASGVKLTVAPLILPWLILAWATRACIFRRPWLTLAGSAWAALVSFIPNVVANLIYVGNASGLSLEPGVLRSAPHVDRLVGNFYLLLLDNVTFPLLAFYPIRYLFEAAPLGPMIRHRFETDSLFLFPYFSVEQEGIGVIVLGAGVLLFAIFARQQNWKRWRDHLSQNKNRLALHASVWGLLFFFMWVSTANQGARLISAYYPFLFATLFAGTEGLRASRFLFHAIAVLGLIATIFCLVCLTNYPLFAIGPIYDQRGVFAKMQEKEIRAIIPASEKNIGIIRYWNEWESWAWKPYGTRRVFELPNDPAPDDLARKQITYVIITQLFLRERAESIRAWTAAHHATVVDELLAHLGQDALVGYYVVKMDGAVAAKPSPQP